jgi:hypothetical protein
MECTASDRWASPVEIDRRGDDGDLGERDGDDRDDQDTAQVPPLKAAVAPSKHQLRCAKHDSRTRVIRLARPRQAACLRSRTRS